MYCEPLNAPWRATLTALLVALGLAVALLAWLWLSEPRMIFYPERALADTPARWRWESGRSRSRPAMA